MKKYFLIILSIINIFFPYTVKAFVQKSSDIYVTDEANILSEKTKNDIIRYSTFLKETENINYYVVTVSDLESLTIDTYVDYVYDSFNLNPNSILIVISKNERRLAVKAGEALSSFITNELIDDYIKLYFIPYYKIGEWDKGTMNGYKAFYKIICEAYNIDASEMTVDFGDAVKEYQYIILMIIIWICTIISYVYSKYLKRVFLNEENMLMNHIVFAISLFINILLLYLSYTLKPLSVLIILLFELITIIGNYNKTNKNVKRKLKRNTKKKSQKKKK